MNNAMDISSLLLIEDSADSEGDTGFFSLCPSAITSANIGLNTKDDEDDDDDAESCTCDDTAGLCSLIKGGEGHEDGQGSGEFCRDGEENYDSDFSSSTMWMSEEALEIGYSSSPNNFLVEDEVGTRIGGKVNVNEVEDKMFWEICMAVGYP